MINRRGFALPWILLLACFHLSSVQASHPAKNKKAIKNQQDLLEKSILTDLETIKEKFNATVDGINKAMTALKKFTDDSIEELENHTRKDMDANDAILDNNLRVLEDYTRERFDNFTSTMLENLGRLSNHTALERAAIIDWAHTRSHRHEDILKTHVALCAYDLGHHGNTKDVVVNYNSVTGGFMDGKKNWQVFNETCNHEECANEVLNRATGVFKFPKNAAGLYMFTFSVTMDVWDSGSGIEPAEYQFRKNGAKLDGTKFYCDIGSSRHHDQVQGSKTILLKLAEDDEVDVVQLRDTDVADSRISFCGALIHLDKASESPGGLGADVTNPDFPVGTMPGLCIDQASPTCLTDHKYAFGKTPDCESKEVPKCEFEAVPKATAFKYDTDGNTAATDTKMDDAQLKLSPLPADATKYDNLSPS